VPDETGREFSGNIQSDATSQLPLSRVEIRVLTIIVKLVLSAIFSPISVKLTDIGSWEVYGTDGGSQNCVVAESSASGGGLLGGGALLNGDLKFGFVSNPTAKKPAEISQQITANATIPFRLDVASRPLLCCLAVFA
jgi:hypothetical protein